MANNNDLNINIRINSDTKALEITKNGFTSVKQKIGESSNAADDFSRKIMDIAHTGEALALLGRAFDMVQEPMRKAIETADKWNLLEGRLRLVTSSTAELVMAQQSLFAISQESRVSYEQTADLYARIARSTESLGKSQSQTMEVTEAINKSLVISGASAESANAALVQLGQGFASGVLRGEELNSVMEQSPRLAQAIADGMGVTIGQLRAMGADGKLTAEKVYEAIRSQKDAIESEFGKMPQTVGQSMQVLQNQIGKTISEFDKMHGVTSSISESIMALTKSIGNADEAIEALGKTAGIAATVFLAYKANGWIDTGAKAIGASFLGASSGVDRMLASTIALESSMMRIKKFLAANVLTLTIGVVLTGSELAKSWLEDPSNKYGIGQDKIDAYKKSVSALSSTENQARMVGSEYNKQSETLNNQLKARAELVKRGIDTSHVDAAIAKTKATLGDIQKAAKEVYAINEKPKLPSPSTTDKLKTGKTGKSEAQIEREKELAKIEKWNHDLNQGVLSSISERTLAYQKESDERIESDKKAIETRISSEKELYSSLLQLSGDWYTAESIKIGEQYVEWEKAGIDKLKLEEWLNASMFALDKKRTDEQSELSKKRFEDENSAWINFFGNTEKAMDNQLFDAMVGKWTSFGDWFKDFWSSLSTSVVRALSSQLSTSITGSIKDMLLGTSGQGGIQNVFKSYGGLGSVLGFTAPAALAGASTDSAGFTTTTGGTVFDAAGQITKEGSDVSSVMSLLSNGSSIYSAISGGMAMSGASAMASLESLSTSLGWTTGAEFFGGAASGMLGTGSGLTGAMGAGSSMGGFMAAAAPVAATIAAAYIAARGIDKLTGSDTYSMGLFDGSVFKDWGKLSTSEKFLSVALPFLGGGLVGKKKDNGVTIEGTATSDYADGHFDWKKKSWFSSKTGISRWFNDDEKDEISGIIGSYDYLLGQMGVLDKKLAISGGKFASIQDFLDRGVARTFIDTITTADTTEMYNAWSDYAGSINKTIQAALSDSINTYIGDTRNFQTWMLGRSGDNLEALKLKSEWATADTDNLQKMLGLDGVTVDNYLTKYKDAINNSFDPQTLKNYKTLGEQLMNNAEAADAYTNALKEQAAVSEKMRPADMMLSRVSDTTSVTGSADGTVTKELLNAFNKLIRSIDQQNTLAQLAAGRV